MIREEEKDPWKTYSRSVSWTERPPRKSTSGPQSNNKTRACLPPLQPLSIIRPSIDEWPKAGSDDLGIWPNPPTPGAKRGSRTPRENSTSGDRPPKEFEFRKDKLAFFNKECSRILDHVYLGSDAIARNREILRQNGITHVLNCVGFVCPEYFKNELTYKTLWLQDCPSEDITSILYDVFDYFEDVREQGGRVLVHCCQGVSRSTSLVIAYLIWKEGNSFDDAFQHVKAARDVTNPNVGFACQLLQCQKRVHALPASPTSVIRMYRMAPHSPYDPLHLVPKMLSEPGPDRLDTRGAFIVHVPSTLYVWIGRDCSQVMSDNARAAASQVIRYERARGPVIAVKEGQESSEFWDALDSRKISDQNKLCEYDLDFEIFHRALAGGVVPPFPLSEAESETCLPTRENGWNRLRRKFSIGIVKELITCLKFNSSGSKIYDGPEIMHTGSPDSSFVTKSPNFKDTSLPKSLPFSLVDSYSPLLVDKTKSNSISPSFSPATSDYSSSFTFSPSSSNWSDLSFVSAQPSLYGLDSSYMDVGESGLLEESVDFAEASTNLLDNRRRNDPIFPSADDPSQISRKLARYLEDDIMRVAQCNNLSRLQDDKKYAACNASHDMTNKNADATNMLFYKWPSMNKMDMNYGILDSRSVYIILMQAVGSGMSISDVLYVWIGRDVSSADGYTQLVMNNSDCEDGRAHVETVDRNLLIEKGFSRDAHITIVKEGEEPVQLLDHFSRLSLGLRRGSQLDGGIKIE